MSLAALSCGLLGTFGLFKFIVDLKALKNGDEWNMSSDDDSGPFWSWPRDKWKIGRRSAGLLFVSIGLLWAAVVLARKALHAWPF